jgi:hypothetical protein
MERVQYCVHWGSVAIPERHLLERRTPSRRKQAVSECLVRRIHLSDVLIDLFQSVKICGFPSTRALFFSA